MEPLESPAPLPPKASELLEETLLKDRLLFDVVVVIDVSGAVVVFAFVREDVVVVVVEVSVEVEVESVLLLLLLLLL